MLNEKDTQKVGLYIELFPYEKDAFVNWIQGKFPSITAAIQHHIRKVTGLDPESQDNSEKNPGPQENVD